MAKSSGGAGRATAAGGVRVDEDGRRSDGGYVVDTVDALKKLSGGESYLLGADGKLWWHREGLIHADVVDSLMNSPDFHASMGLGRDYVARGGYAGDPYDYITEAISAGAIRVRTSRYNGLEVNIQVDKFDSRADLRRVQRLLDAGKLPYLPKGAYVIAANRDNMTYTSPLSELMSAKDITDLAAW